MADNSTTIKFVKACLKDEGFSKELITYLFSTYDLESFLNETVMNKLEVATHFLGHARHIEHLTSKY